MLRRVAILLTVACWTLSAGDVPGQGPSGDPPASSSTTEAAGDAAEPPPAAAAAIVATPVITPPPKEFNPDKINWSGLLKQSAFFLGIQHGVRYAVEPESRKELVGPFFKEYFESVRGLHGWHDGDPAIVNYVGHPMMGAVSSRIFLHNDPKAARAEFGWNKGYWWSRLKGMGWAAAYSTQFELGPAGEAAWGNIGGKPWPDGMGYVDLVGTPVLGSVVVIAEDAIDRYVVRWVERRTTNRSIIALTRVFGNPTRSFTNLIGFREPWRRDTRPGINILSGHRLKH